MSAGHANKKARQAATLLNWNVGSKRKVDGVIYASRKDARIARDTARKDAALVSKLHKETDNGREEADRSAP